MKYEGGLFEARSIGELDAQLRGLSENGFRIINVLDRSSTYDDRFLIVVQKDVDAHIHSPSVGDLAKEVVRKRNPRDRDILSAENASLKAREKVDANLLLAAYKGLLVLHRMLSKSGLSVGAETATYITDQIAAAHPEMPGLASLRAAPTDPGEVI